MEEEVVAHNYPCGKAIESGTQHKKKRHVLLGEMWEVKEGGMKSLDALDSREKTIVILGDRR